MAQSPDQLADSLPVRAEVTQSVSHGPRGPLQRQGNLAGGAGPAYCAEPINACVTGPSDRATCHPCGNDTGIELTGKQIQGLINSTREDAEAERYRSVEAAPREAGPEIGGAVRR